MSKRIYGLEGAPHFYSSLPSCIYPADLYWIKDNVEIKNYLANTNIYLIVRRKQIIIDTDPNNWFYKDNNFYGNFMVQDNSAQVSIPFSLKITPELAGTFDPVESVKVDSKGLSIHVISRHKVISSQMHKIIALAESSLPNKFRDLEVLYVGQALGRKNVRSAIDRLLNHSILQRILAESITYGSQDEILLLLYNFEHQKLFVSTGGDLTLEPQINPDEDFAHFLNMKNISFTRQEVVSLVEAALINYFKPFYNTLLKNTSFEAKRKIQLLQKVMSKDLTGLIVEICSSNIKSKLWSRDAYPKELEEIFEPAVLTGKNLDSEELKQQWKEELIQYEHTHQIMYALTTTEERNTFFHGLKWQD